MDLARPEWLYWSPAVLPVLAVGAAALGPRRSRDWSALGQGGRPARDGSAFWLAAAACLFVALAGPRWGRFDEQPLPPGHDVVLALDVSRSMAAGDAVPDRLGLAVESAAGLVETLGTRGEDRVAVVAFDGRGVLRCPLTRNLGAAVETLRSLRPGELRPGGTDLAAGLDAAVDAFDDLDHAGGRVVVVFSDGEDHVGRWAGAVGRLKANGVIAHAVAVGDAGAGHTVPSNPGKAGSEPIRYHGSVVLSRRSDATLATLARETGGAFVPLGLATADLGRLYRTRIEPGARRGRRSDPASEPAERFPLFLALGLVLAVASAWPGRPSRVAARGLLALAAVGAGASPKNDPAAAIGAGRAAYTSGRYAEALEAFREAARLAPGNAVASYNVAATLFRLGRYAEARASYSVARTRADAALRTRIDYALGNTALALGDLEGAVRSYDDCLGSTAPGADLVAVRRDAAVNRRFVEDQARPNPVPPETGGSGPDPPGPSGQGRQPPDPKTKNGGGGGSKSPGDGSTPGARGAGGAGGSGPSPPRAGSPEDQLEKALENVREARKRRIDEATVNEEGDDQKDW